LGGEAVFLLEAGEGGEDGFAGGGAGGVVGCLGPGGALLGGGAGCCGGGLRGGDLGDGGDGAEVFIEDELFDQVAGIVCAEAAGDGVLGDGVIGDGFFGAGFAAGEEVVDGEGACAGVAAVGVAGASAGGACGGTGFVEVPDGQLEGVEDWVGALWVELAGGEAVEDLGESELDAGAVVDGGHLEDRLGGVDAAVARGWAAGGMVVITEGFSAQGGGAATVARGVDVTAEEALDGGLGGFGGCDCVGHTVPLLWGGGVPPPEIHKIFKIR
jgi:hypothetical protein